MVEACCNALGNELGVGEWYQGKTKYGKNLEGCEVLKDVRKAIK